MKPTISLYGASNRPQLWQWFASTLVANKIPYEIVLTGDIEPDFPLPPNVRFIATTVKVSQCVHIAGLCCEGEVMLHIGDDLEFYGDSIDKLYERYLKENDYKCMVWSKYGTPENDQTDYSITSGHGVLMSRKFYLELGGYDRRYYCNTYDVDLQYRALSSQFGGRFVYADDSFMVERKDLCPGGWLSGGWYKHRGILDVKFMQSQWFDENNKPKKVPTTPPELFENNNTLTTVSQGNIQDWDITHTRIKKHNSNARIAGIGGTVLSIQSDNVPRTIG